MGSPFFGISDRIQGENERADLGAWAGLRMPGHLGIHMLFIMLTTLTIHKPLHTVMPSSADDF